MKVSLQYWVAEHCIRRLRTSGSHKFLIIWSFEHCDHLFSYVFARSTRRYRENEHPRWLDKHKMRIEVWKRRNAITFDSVVRLRRFFFSFHITFRDLCAPNSQRRFAPTFLPNSTSFLRYGVFKFVPHNFLIIQALFTYNGLPRLIFVYRILNNWWWILPLCNYKHQKCKHRSRKVQINILWG